MAQHEEALITKGYKGLILKLASTYSSVPSDTVPSALEGLTSVFGMVTGVAPPLLTPAKRFSAVKLPTWNWSGKV